MKIVKCSFYFIDVPLRAIAKLVTSMGLKKRTHILEYLVKTGDPAVISNTYGSVVGCVPNSDSREYYVCISGGFRFQVDTLPLMITRVVQLFYVLNIEFPAAAQSLLKFFACCHGDVTYCNSLSRSQKALL